MIIKRLRRAASTGTLLAACHLVLACSSDSPECAAGANCAAADSGSDAADATADAADVEADTGPPAICNPGTRYEVGTPVYREVTEEWGLAGVQGTRISLGDIDGDGWIDAFVRRGGTQSNDWGPEGTRTSFLMRNDHGTFVDFTAESGIDDPRYPSENMGRPYEIVAFADVDNDGDLDAYTGATTVDPAVARNETSEIMINSGDGFFSFTLESNAIRLAGGIDVPAGASFVDADRDGFVDLWVPQHNYEPRGGGIAFKQDIFYRGGGDGLFADITDIAGLTTVDWDSVDDLNQGLAHSRAWSATACDLNNDGTTELMAASYGRAPSHLWQGQSLEGGGITFTNRSVASGYAYDENTSWQDNQFARCFCADNRDAEGCADVEAPSLSSCQANWNHANDREAFRLGGNSGATVCADLNNDGWMDLITTEIRHWWAGDGADGSDILLNLGESEVRFDRERRRELLGFVVRHGTLAWDEGHMSATVLDFDNDGWPDFYIGASDYPGNFGLLYHQSQPEFWTEVPVSEGFEHNRSHGVAAADFDRDGDLDIMVGHSRSRCDEAAPNNCYETAQIRVFENVLGDQGNWIQLDLEGGAGSNRAAIGARVSVTAGDVTQTQQVGGGYGHYGAQNDMVLHFGLGAECEADVTITWPNTELTQQTFHVGGGYRYHVAQGQEPVAATRE